MQSSVIFDKKIFFNILFGLSVTELISLWNYVYFKESAVIFFLIIACYAVLCLKKLDWGLYLILAELFIGGKGYLFFLATGNFVISLRVALFSIFLLIWFLKKIKNFGFTFSNYLKDTSIRILLVLFMFILYAFFNGYTNNSLKNVFLDFNAWLFFLLVFAFLDIFKERRVFNITLLLLFTTVITTAVKTAAVLFLFSHKIFTVGDIFYKWIRDTGVGEITHIDQSLFRVFFQSHVYALISAALILGFLFTKMQFKKNESVFFGAVLYFSLFILVAGQSRSFWLSGIISVILMTIYSLISKKNFKALVFPIFLFIIIFSLGSLTALISGYPSGNIFLVRSKSLQAESSASSRKNQFLPLIKQIKKNPLLGSGFGTEVEYISNDPRIRQKNPDGVYKTYAFEWGYLDMVVKLGFLGVGIFLLYLFFLFKESKHFFNDNVFLLPLIFSGFSLLVVHMVTPYLNHPLGIGFILLLSAYTFSLKTKTAISQK